MIDFKTWSNALLAAECRSQARCQLDPEFSRFMAELADRLSEVGTIVDWLRSQSDEGARIALTMNKGSTARASYGGGSYALKRVADMIERGEHREVAAHG
ncbi:hypothetical protein [Sphingobium yanoikuyae]|uniref:Uncharacterized protein n=1 Tax=Sphingobium yanoikuyae TaxID=13690 RepID=A0A430BWN9_SPHYA|nr:hypothetical protein [Sphingobium yanoikuyae]RSU57188.1 hypothetical protein DAH51_10270 [Sphingobium yanoikuyae]